MNEEETIYHFHTTHFDHWTLAELWDSVSRTCVAGIYRPGIYDARVVCVPGIVAARKAIAFAG